MRQLRALWYRIDGMFAGRRAERELTAEIESHLELHADDYDRAGLSPAEARRRAVLALGGVEAGARTRGRTVRAVSCTPWPSASTQS